MAARPSERVTTTTTREAVGEEGAGGNTTTTPTTSETDDEVGCVGRKDGQGTEDMEEEVFV